MTPDAGPRLIGWKERVEFPDWGLRRVKVKIDTGARTWALGVAGCELTEGGTVAVLRLAPYRRNPDRQTVVRAAVLDTVVVCDSGGHRQARPLIETTVRLGPVTKVVRLTVTDRSTMLFPVILGRAALAGDFVVDVGRKYVLRGQ